MITGLLMCLEEKSQVYPKVVNVYKRRFDSMAEQAYLREFVNYAKIILHDPIGELDWRELLEWEHRHFKYTKGRLPKVRAEMPIEILLQKEGRCGEFALLYNGLLLTRSYVCRLVIDCSTLMDKSKIVAGDHLWNEVLANNAWLHIDPTEKRVDQRLMYATEWNKEVNLVYAISRSGIVNVTESYRL
jgi:hypothetical protein